MELKIILGGWQVILRPRFHARRLHAPAYMYMYLHACTCHMYIYVHVGDNGCVVLTILPVLWL